MHWGETPTLYLFHKISSILSYPLSSPKSIKILSLPTILHYIIYSQIDRLTFGLVAEARRGRTGRRRQGRGRRRGRR